ncbi:MAG: hypothetical protein M1374_07490, partial [Firmicutes bacterium]|nr:hypothetical protein [Bacillota bacterium]
MKLSDLFNKNLRIIFGLGLVVTSVTSLSITSAFAASAVAGYGSLTPKLSYREVIRLDTTAPLKHMPITHDTTKMTLASLSVNPDVSKGGNTASIRVGSYPDAILYDAKENLVYVANYDSNTVSVIKASDSKVVDT